MWRISLSPEPRWLMGRAALYCINLREVGQTPLWLLQRALSGHRQVFTNGFVLVHTWMHERVKWRGSMYVIQERSWKRRTSLEGKCNYGPKWTHLVWKYKSFGKGCLVRKIEKEKGEKEDKQQLIILKMTRKVVVVPLECVGVSDCVLHKQEAECNSQ